MAIVFEKPKKRKKLFFWAITISSIVIPFLVSLIVFPPQFNSDSQTPIPEIPQKNITVNFKVMDSNQIKSLEPFVEPEIEFSYTAIDQNQKEITGTIAASDTPQARKLLEAMGLTIVTIKEALAGNDQPFIPYYKLSATVTKK